MDRNEILDAIKTLSHSQGFYGRLYNSLTDGTESAESALTELEEQNFADVTELVMFIENC